MNYNDIKQPGQNDYKNIYSEEVRIFNDIVSRYRRLQENNIVDAYILKSDALVAFDRWSEIRHDVRMITGKGVQAHLKDRIEDICHTLDEIHIDARMVWGKAQDRYQKYKPD